MSVVARARLWLFGSLVTAVLVACTAQSGARRPPGSSSSSRKPSVAAAVSSPPGGQRSAPSMSVSAPTSAPVGSGVGTPPGGQPPSGPVPPAPGSASVATLHYTANGNIGPTGEYLPGRLGFNLADVGSKSALDQLPAGVSGMVYLGACGGVTAAFQAQVAPFFGDGRLFAFYLIDEPDPATCPPANLAAETAYVHQHLPTVRTFVIVQNLTSSRSPHYSGGYTAANSGIDLFGIDPYPCRSELSGCDFPMIQRYFQAAQRDGIPANRIVPVFQAFGGGTWIDDGGGHYLLPTPAQAAQMISEWTRLLPHPLFDYAYSWGVQRQDAALETASPALQQVFATHNRGA